MKEPLFNSSYYDSDWNDPRGGKLMGLYYIKDMPISDGINRLRCQMFDNGYRVVTENYKPEFWNQTTYEDVDYKNWIIYCKEYLHDESKIIDVLEIHKKVFIYIVKHWGEMFYYSEISRHENGFHYIFYFDIERTKENWKKCKNISHAIVKQAFINCGYEEIINLKKGKSWNDVFDDCTDSEFQLCYITKKHPMMNKFCTGEVKEYPDLEVVDYKPIKTKYVNNGDDYIINIEKHELKEGEIVNYIDHFQRWILYNSLRRCFPQTYENEWIYCCDHMTQTDTHSTSWYKERKEGKDWGNEFNENCYVDKDLLKMFGYDVVFIQKTRNKGNIDFLNLLGI